jgi:hypothetical protein
LGVPTKNATASAAFCSLPTTEVEGFHKKEGLMHPANAEGQHFSEADDEDDYDDLALLEQLETLREDMEDLGVSTLAEVIQRIEELHQHIDKKT